MRTRSLSEADRPDRKFPRLRRHRSSWQSKDLAILILLPVAGLAYFSYFYDSGFNIGDEGSVVLIAARLLEGERPFVDVFLGYGLLWYYPIVVLFKWAGVSFIVTRIYFLSVAVVTSMMAFVTLRTLTSHKALAATIALVLLAVPGTLHKAYIPLIVVANMLFLPSLDCARALTFHQIFGAGLIAAVSFHVRPDLGLLAASVLVATLATHTFSRPGPWTSQLKMMGGILVILTISALVPTLLLLVLAFRQGVLGDFLNYLSSLPGPLTRLFGLAQDGVSPGDTFEVPAGAGATLPRTPITDIWQEGALSWPLAVLTYLPLLSFAMIALIACALLVRRKLQSRPMTSDRTIGVLAFLALAYSAFPQFFLFRPSFHHLSQFMPGYLVLVGVCLGRWVLPASTAAAQGSPSPDALGARKEGWRRAGRVAIAGFFVFHAGFYAWAGLNRQEAGSIALARGRSERFHGSNGVDVNVTPNEKRLFATVTRIVEENTNETDAVLCFPYCPGFNVMTDRRTFQRKLYVDDSMLIKDPAWQTRMAAQIQAEKPPLIIVKDWAVNNTEISRFHNWATLVMEHIESEYVMLERFGSFSFYKRRELLEAQRTAGDALAVAERDSESKTGG